MHSQEADRGLRGREQANLCFWDVSNTGATVVRTQQLYLLSESVELFDEMKDDLECRLRRSDFPSLRWKRSTSALLVFPLPICSGTGRWPTVAEVGIQLGCLMDEDETIDIHEGWRGPKTLLEDDVGVPIGGAIDDVSICSHEKIQPKKIWEKIGTKKGMLECL